MLLRLCDTERRYKRHGKEELNEKVVRQEVRRQEDDEEQEQVSPAAGHVADAGKLIEQS
jgi:hypothetical protein